jgi:hypothetical protein
MSQTQQDPWLRLRGESRQAYAAFRVFLELGRERSVIEAFRQSKGNERATQPSGCWNKWRSRWNWEERAAAYDEHLDRVAQRDLERQLGEMNEIWLRREREQREQLWAKGEELIKRAEQILQWPLEEVTKEVRSGADGETVTVMTVMPARWRLRDAAYILKVAMDLKLLSLERPTLHVKVDKELADREAYEMVAGFVADAVASEGLDEEECWRAAEQFFPDEIQKAKRYKAWLLGPK